jgi:hypothetical protein
MNPELLVGGDPLIVYNSDLISQLFFLSLVGWWPPGSRATPPPGGRPGRSTTGVPV